MNYIIKFYYNNIYNLTEKSYIKEGKVIIEKNYDL